MATIAIGDIHGNREALDDLLTTLDPELRGGDTVVFLGDYIDRGPDSRGCIDSILRFKASGRARVVALLGNHEDWLLRTVDNPRRHSWLLGMEALDTIASYSAAAAVVMRRAMQEAGAKLFEKDYPLPYEAFFSAMLAEHLDFLVGLQVVHVADGAVFSHGGLDPAVTRLDEQSKDALVWGTRTFPDDYAGPDTVIYGHWDNAVLDKDGYPGPMQGHCSIGIDTIKHGVLTALRWPDRRLFQSRRCRTS